MKFLNISICFFLLALSSCSNKNVELDEYGSPKILPVEDLYKDAVKKMDKKEFKSAAKSFEKLQENYPYTKLAVKGRILGAYCKYQAHLYEDAIDEFTIFAKLYPGHKDTPYAYYMIGLSYYERISIAQRDQEDSIEALKAFQTILDLFPTCDYAKDAKFKIDFIKSHLAAQEMEIGRFYQKEKSYVAAINRFKNVVTKYQTTQHTPESLYRLIECYVALNMKDEVKEIFDVLKLNHSKTEWFKYASKLHDEFIKNNKG